MSHLKKRATARLKGCPAQDDWVSFRKESRHIQTYARVLANGCRRRLRVARRRSWMKLCRSRLARCLFGSGINGADL